MITINYLPYRRIHFHSLLFHFMNLIKEENKKELILNIYTSDVGYFQQVVGKLKNIKYKIIPSNKIYISKIQEIKKYNNEEYSIKLDEDIFLNNHIWDYMIENKHLLNDKENLLLTPLLSCGIPTNDYFVNGYFNEEQQEQIRSTFLKVDFGIVPTCWGYDYRHLNKYTIQAETWDYEAFLEEANNINHHFKGVHPIRIGYECQRIFNQLLSDNPENFVNCQKFSIMPLKNRYFTNSFFLIKSQTWLEILNNKSLYVDPYDEVPLNKYAQKYDLNMLFINGAFAIHTNYNTNMHPDKHTQQENTFVKKIEDYCKRILI